jgi:NitT/TauT family transport system substrate-binding protein
MRIRLLEKVVVYAGLALAAFQFGTGAYAQGANKVRIGDVSPIAAAWPQFVAVDKGMLRRAGVEPEVTYVGNVANTVQQLAAGSFEFAQSTFDTAVRAIESGADAVIVGATVIKYPYSIMSAANVRTAADMKGKRIVLPFPKDFLTILWNRWLREQGMNPADVEQIYDGATPNRFAALSANRAQAAALGGPFDFRAADQGFYKLLDLGAFGKEFGFLVVLSRPKWLRENPDTARAYLRALSEATDFLYDPANREEAIDILARNTKQDRQIAARTYDYFIKEAQVFSRKLQVPDTIVQNTVRTLIEIGDLKAGDARKKLTDIGYLPR